MVDLPEFLCECSRNDCSETRALPLPEYERIRSSPNLFVIAPDHECPEVDRVVEARHDSQLVEKTKHLELVLSCIESRPALRRRLNRSTATQGGQPIPFRRVRRYTL